MKMSPSLCDRDVHRPYDYIYMCFLSRLVHINVLSLLGGKQAKQFQSIYLRWEYKQYLYIHFYSFIKEDQQLKSVRALRVAPDQCTFLSTKKPVTNMLTYPWKCTVLHCNHLGNTWKPLVLMTRHFDYCPSASEC